MSERNEEDEEELFDDEDDFNKIFTKKLNADLDALEQKKVDAKRIKLKDQSKKMAVLESVLDERTRFELNKILTNGPLDRIEGVISAGKEANVYLG